MIVEVFTLGRIYLVNSTVLINGFIKYAPFDEIRSDATYGNSLEDSA